MKQYLEILEIGEKQNLKQVKLKVKDKNEAIDKLAIEEPAFIGLNYIKRIHYCYHDEGNAPCSTENL